MVTVVAVLVFILLCLACWKIEVTQAEVRDAEERLTAAVKDHLECHTKIEEQILHMVKSNGHAALLRKMAEKWDDPGHKPYLDKLAREEFKLDGPSMPAIWLNRQADMLEVVEMKVIHDV